MKVGALKCGLSCEAPASPKFHERTPKREGGPTEGGPTEGGSDGQKKHEKHQEKTSTNTKENKKKHGAKRGPPQDCSEK